MSSFDTIKINTLAGLSAGIDLSFKGSIDTPILELVAFLNSLRDYFTTSSCSGRVSVFQSGRSAKHIHWILVKHRLFTIKEILGTIDKLREQSSYSTSGLVSLKCEAFILHVNCRDLDSARTLHNIANLCGFRESGIKMSNRKIILAIRTTSFGMELPIAKGSDLLVSESYLDLIVKECNSRLANNFARADKFLLELKKHWQWPSLIVFGNQTTCNQTNHTLIANNLKRWGHSSTHGSNCSYIIGGYGCDAITCEKSSSDKCSRGLKAVTLTEQHKSRNSNFSTFFFSDDCMHAVTVSLQLRPMISKSLHSSGDSLELLLLSGGRTSPCSPALPCVRLYYNSCSSSSSSKGDNMKEPTFTIVPIVQYSSNSSGSGDNTPPAPRWGHSLTCISYTATNTQTNTTSSAVEKRTLDGDIVRNATTSPESSTSTGGNTSTVMTYLLYGGRDAVQIFNDAYILTVSLIYICDDSSNSDNNNSASCEKGQYYAVCTWKRLPLTVVVKNSKVKDALYEDDDNDDGIDNNNPDSGKSMIVSGDVSMTAAAGNSVTIDAIGNIDNNNSASSIVDTELQWIINSSGRFFHAACNTLNVSPTNDDHTINNDNRNVPSTIAAADYSITVDTKLIQDISVTPDDTQQLHIYQQQQQQQKYEYNMVVIHGGITSLGDPDTCDAGCLIDPNTGDVYPLHRHHDSSSSSGSLSAAATADASKYNGVVRRFGHTLTSIGGKSMLLIGGTSFQPSFSSSSSRCCNNSSSSSSSSDDNGQQQCDNPSNSHPTLVLDLYMDATGSYCGSYRHVPLSINSKGTSNDMDDTTTDSTQRQLHQQQQLPCQGCRVHHQTLYYPRRSHSHSNNNSNSNSNELCILGGGAMTLAFGAHFCPNVFAIVATNEEEQCDTFISNNNDNNSSGNSDNNRDMNSHEHSSNMDANIFDYQLKSSNTKASSVPRNATSSAVIYAPAVAVRTLKVFLESQKMLDKSRSITKIDASIPCIDSGSNGNLGSSETESGEAVAHCLLVPATACNTNNSSNTSNSANDKDSMIVPAGFMAVPIISSLYLQLKQQSNTLHNELLESICQCLAHVPAIKLVPTTGTIPATNLHPITSTTPITTNANSESIDTITTTTITADYIFFGTSSSSAQSKNKRSQSNGNQKAIDLLTELCQKHRLPLNTTAKNDNAISSSIAIKFEIVGDILMLPEGCLTGSAWDSLLGLPSQTPSAFTAIKPPKASSSAPPRPVVVVAKGNNHGIVSEVVASSEDIVMPKEHQIQYGYSVYAALAACFGLHRVARKAAIDAGPMRESRVVLLYPTYHCGSNRDSNNHNIVNSGDNNSVSNSSVSYGGDSNKDINSKGSDSNKDSNSKGSDSNKDSSSKGSDSNKDSSSKGSDRSSSVSLVTASPGWVEVWENKICFGFDITKVMFCSGNVTERMRMGSLIALQKQKEQQQYPYHSYLSSKDQVVVDFYCGIGYYTVPLLVHGGAKHIHACEWNPNSVAALTENLRRAGGDVSSRCTIYAGDNQVSAKQLVNLADRVLLGLLPSSVAGWPLAASAVKPIPGSIIHVHENVLESELKDWQESTRVTFEQLLQDCGKGHLRVEIIHLEKVKSYAPRVYHVVLDLLLLSKINQ